MQVLTMALGSIGPDVISELEDANPWAALIFIFFQIVIIYLVFINIFLAVVSQFFSEAYKELKRDSLVCSAASLRWLYGSRCMMYDRCRRSCSFSCTRASGRGSSFCSRRRG
jgi:hypothetical protein